MDFYLFAKDMGKRLSNKYGQKRLDSAKKSTTDTIKTASERAVQKTAEATGDLTGNKITSVSKKSAKELHNNDETEEQVERVTPYLQKKDNKLLMN